jgi:acetyltransferase-like isoleucine patch superfamily enzyme
MAGIKEWGCGKYHKPIIGKNVTMSGDEPVFMDTQAQITIGDDSFMGHGVKFLTGGHDYFKFGNERQITRITKPIMVGKGVWIGSFAIILGGVTIGDHAVIGAGAVVTRNIPAYSVAVGVPAKVIKMIPH